MTYSTFSIKYCTATRYDAFVSMNWSLIPHEVRTQWKIHHFCFVLILRASQDLGGEACMKQNIVMYSNSRFYFCSVIESQDFAIYCGPIKLGVLHQSTSQVFLFFWAPGVYLDTVLCNEADVLLICLLAYALFI